LTENRGQKTENRRHNIHNVGAALVPARNNTQLSKIGEMIDKWAQTSSAPTINIFGEFMKVLICAAGSGGHIYPALSLARCLCQNDKSIQIFFLSSKKAINQDILAKEAYRVFTTDFISPYQGKGWNLFKFSLKNLVFLIKFKIESIKVFFLILRTKPDAVIGFGGITSITAILVSRLLGIPTLIHEQNLIPGKANKFISRIATKVAVGFKKSRIYFKRDIIFTGNLIRPDIEKIDKTIACEGLGLKKDLFTILVFGGSQGSESINKSFMQAIAKLDHDFRNKLNIIHISGPKDILKLKDFYRQLNIEAKLFAYCTNMSIVYNAADLLISRAGAGTINEVCFLGKPCIFIPYPYAGGHQKVNAEFMRENGAACVVFQNDLTAFHLQKDIERLITKRNILNSMSEKCKQLFVPNAEVKLTEIVLNMLKPQAKTNHIT